MLAAAPLAHRLTNRFAARIPLVIGMLCSAAAFGTLAMAHDALWPFYAAGPLIGFGHGLSSPRGELSW